MALSINFEGVEGGTKRGALGVKIINERRGPEFKAGRAEKIVERH